ncbi:bifunctional UDP-N-acetylglucosamine diphosphorylase/glucosamine-1-phosphate N-acetyltransferase GlmU [Pseudomonadota bacterium]
MQLEIIIIAAGKGTRMRSERPKVLHELGGKPLISHVLQSAHLLDAARIHVVVGHGSEQVRQAALNDDINWVLQGQQLGTAHAVQAAMPHVDDRNLVLVLNGDVPLISTDSLKKLASSALQERLAILTMNLADPSGYGRVLRDKKGEINGIVEHKDASDEQLQIKEVYTGFLAAPKIELESWLQKVNSNNVQGEFYLTDIISIAANSHYPINDQQPADDWEVMGINSKNDLAVLERVYQHNQARKLMNNGLKLIDPNRFDLRGELEFGSDCELDANVIIEGKVCLGDRVKIGPNNVIRDTTIKSDVRVEANCVLDGANISSDCNIGPFARLRPGTNLSNKVRIGNFVEVKQSLLGKGSKVNHLSYVGDSKVGQQVNIGAGTITCNYDGANKHLTEIGDKAFIGSNSALVAPVYIGAGATIGAGSTISGKVRADALTMTRSEQKTVKDWKRPIKNSKD